MISCENKKTQDDKDLKTDLQAMSEEFNKNKIDLMLNATPKYFSVKTVSGKQFNSEDYKGKDLVIFIYDKSYLKKSDTYDMTAELNEIYNSNKDKVQFIGIIEGFVDDDAELKDYIKNSKLEFDQIDNTVSQNKEEKLIHNISCTPAKILIDKTGKVIASSCGGKSSVELLDKLEKL
jgi:cytochrome oxidase Cu insertion factor (SCO1/SenC/PrrC family)